MPLGGKKVIKKERRGEGKKLGKTTPLLAPGNAFLNKRRLKIWQLFGYLSWRMPGTHGTYVGTVQKVK